jgi:Carboxypeptidase regulatory-like domain
MRWHLRIPLAWAVAFLAVADLAFAQQTGTLSGVVSDAQGALLPGVTITLDSPALAGAERQAVSGESGAYAFASLPPGVYRLTFTLTGFTTLRREEVRVQVATVTRVDVELAVGGVSETMTVSGESPVVDVSSTTTQTNVDKELFDAIPTGRNPWVMAGLVPGVVTGRLDVGGTEGMQQYNLEVFGSADSQKSFSIDGLKTNWPGTNGGQTMQYYGFEMYEEYNMQTSSGTAESDTSGVYMNMVTRSGTNRFASEHNFYFMNDALQGTNVDDDLKRRLGLQPTDQTGAAGNPIDISYDWSSTIGGPIKRDTLFFFGALRRWRLDQFQIGALNPDGSQAIDDNRIENYMGKATWQANSSTRTSFMFNRNLKYRFHRRDSPYLFVEDKASVLQDQPANNYVLQANRVVGASMVIDARFGRMWGVFPSHYQDAVGPNDIAMRDTVRFTRVNAAEENNDNPNHRYQFNAALTMFRDKLIAGTHEFKIGLQISRERMVYNRDRNGDILLELQDGVPFQAQLANTPVRSDHRLNTWGLFLQDQWRVRRITVNAGLRLDGVRGRVPAQSSPAGTWAGERSFDEITGVPDFSINVAPRLGVAYDLFGTGRTALKAYYGRFYNQFGSEILESVNQNGLALIPVRWTDSNNNVRLDPGELAPFAGFPRGFFPRMDPDAKRPYSDEVNIGIDHTLIKNLSVAVSYHRRQHRDGLGVVDLDRPTSAYTPVERTYNDPERGSQTITVYNLDAAAAARRNRLITNVDFLRSNYNGVAIDVQKRMSDRWQLLSGLTFQTHKGFRHSGTFTNPGNTADLNDPNFLLNRDDGAVFIDLPWTFTLAGTYVLPYEIALSGKYTARKGDPLARQLSVSGLNQGTETVFVQQHGEDRTDTVNKFVDIRFARSFPLGPARLEGTMDVFNLLNANHVLLQTETIGSTLGRPSRILSPRVIRFGVTARF